MISTYDLADRIQKAETVKDGQAILDEALELLKSTNKFNEKISKIEDQAQPFLDKITKELHNPTNFDPIDDPREYGVGL